jgi:hypothetical protein
VVYFLAAFLLWIGTTPVCNNILAFCGEKVVMIFDSYDITKSISTSGKTIIVKYEPSPDGKPHLINSRNITFNVVFLLALIMAVPDVHYRLRLKILLLGIALLFPVQVLRLSTYILNYYGQHMLMDGNSLYPIVWRKALFFGDLTLTRLDSMLIPVIIWAGLFFYYKWHYKFLRKNSK